MGVYATCNVCGVTDTRPDEAWEYNPGGFGWAHVGCVARVSDRTNDSRQRQQAAAESLFAALENEVAEAELAEDRLLAKLTAERGGRSEVPELEAAAPDWARRAPVWLGVAVFVALCCAGAGLLWLVWFLAWAVVGA
jgi:hypothetical protein